MPVELMQIDSLAIIAEALRYNQDTTFFSWFADTPSRIQEQIFFFRKKLRGCHFFAALLRFQLLATGFPHPFLIINLIRSPCRATSLPLDSKSLRSVINASDFHPLPKKAMDFLITDSHPQL